MEYTHAFGIRAEEQGIKHEILDFYFKCSSWVNEIHFFRIDSPFKIIQCASMHLGLVRDNV